jgi:predicted nucleotidyltransferase
MRDITKNEMNAVLAIVKSPEIMYNANSLAKVLGITSMGTLKILKRLEKENIIKAKQVGKAVTYRINMESEYVRRYVTLLLSREALHAPSMVRRWINEVRKIKNVSVAVLFGSVLCKKDPNDIDVLLITDKKRFPKLEKEIKELNKINVKEIHPMYQSFDDIIENIKKRDKPILNAIKGIMVCGEETFFQIYDESRKE